MEIRIVMDQVEPPVGSLRVLPGAGPSQGAESHEEILFTGWLRLLRALSEVTGARDSRATGE